MEIIFLSIVLIIICISISVTSYYMVKALRLDITIKERRYIRKFAKEIIKFIYSA